jgi:hypothetical protein
MMMMMMRRRRLVIVAWRIWRWTRRFVVVRGCRRRVTMMILVMAGSVIIVIMITRLPLMTLLVVIIVGFRLSAVFIRTRWRWGIVCVIGRRGRRMVSIVIRRRGGIIGRGI